MLSDVYRLAVQERDALRARSHAARINGDNDLAESLLDQWSEQQRVCWALTHRIDARTMHARGQTVLCQPKDSDDRGAWLEPDLAGIVADLESVVAHYSGAAGDREGPLRSAEAALRYVLVLRDAKTG